MMTTFVFAEPPEICVIRAEIPCAITDKKMLFTALADVLKFPDYFGMNWDALNECICDLSWLPAAHVNIIHHDIPLIKDKKELTTYLSILDSAVREWETVGSNCIFLYPERKNPNTEPLIAHRKLFVTFPIEYKEFIESILKKTD